MYGVSPKSQNNLYSLTELNFLIAQGLGDKEMGKLAVTALSYLLEVPFAAIGLFEENSNTWTVLGQRMEHPVETDMGKELALLLETELAEMAFATAGFPLLADLPSAVGKVPEPLANIGIKSLLLAPVRTIHHKFGVMMIGNDLAHDYTPEQRLFVSSVTNQMAIALENARLYAQARDSETFSSSLLDNSPNPMTVINPDTSIRYVNRALEKVTGFSSKELIGTKIPYPWWPEESLDEFIRLFKDIIVTGWKQVERPFKKKNGERFWVEITATPVTIDGEFKYRLTNWTDITERKQSEQALRESNEFNSRLLDTSPNPILVFNADTSIRYVNPAFESLTGFSSDELIGIKAPYPWWPEERYKEIFKALKKAIRKGIQHDEQLFQKKNGEEFYVEITATPFIDIGESKYRLANWIDITARKKAEEREKEIQQELHLSSRLASIGQLAAGVAHEINNPLTAVLGFSQRLLRKSTDDKTRHDLEIVHSETLRAARIVQNLLTFARRNRPKKEYSSINDIIRKSLELRAYVLRTSNVEVVTDLDPTLPSTMVDFNQIQEVFLNIIINAEQAMTETRGSGKLAIKTEEIKGRVRASFADDGPGIPLEYLDKLFDPFFTLRADKDGTGLGLSVCHGIVTEHNGRIYAKNRPAGGAIFHVELPIIADKSII